MHFPPPLRSLQLVLSFIWQQLQRLGKRKAYSKYIPPNPQTSLSKSCISILFLLSLVENQTPGLSSHLALTGVALLLNEYSNWSFYPPILKCCFDFYTSCCWIVLVKTLCQNIQDYKNRLSSYLVNQISKILLTFPRDTASKMLLKVNLQPLSHHPVLISL